MRPIVDGLEADYQDQIDFIRLNAAGADGLATFRHYGLFGHPSYLMLNPAGDVLWSGTGEISSEAIDQEVSSRLAGDK